MIELISRLLQDVHAAPDLRHALSTIVTRIKETLLADVCSIYLNDEETYENILMATDGLRSEAVGQLKLPAGEGLVGAIVERAESINLADAQEHASYRFSSLSGEAPYHAFLGVPLTYRRRVLGVVVVRRRGVCRFTQDEEALLVTICAQLSSVLIQAQVNETLDLLDDNIHDPDETLILQGVSGAKGVCVGIASVVYVTTRLDAVPDRLIDPCEIPAEQERFRTAVQTELEEIRALEKRMSRLLSAGDQALFEAYALLLSGDSLVQGTLDRIATGSWAEMALRDTVEEYANAFEEMEDDYLRGRAADIRDLGTRLLQRLSQPVIDGSHKKEYPEGTILVGEELGVTDLMDVPLERLIGLISERGSGASHVALLARGMNVPAVFGVDNMPFPRLDGREVVLDGYSGRIYVQPGEALREEFIRLQNEEKQLNKELLGLKKLPAETPDGHRVRLFANIGILADIATARDVGAEGVGLYRSEIHFFLRDRFPTEEEQSALYERVLSSFPRKTVTIRTLDIGGDKSLPYFPIEEENPFLGWRGIRISLDQRDIFRSQIRAILRATAVHKNSAAIMLPMVSTYTELKEALDLIQQVHQDLLKDGVQVKLPPVGTMLEVPSLAYQLPAILPLVDFISIGSNDLTQYFFAADRTNERVANLYDHLHPAFLNLLCQINEKAKTMETPVSICGEMAADPLAIPLLFAMGISTLSMGRTGIPKAKWIVRSIPLKAAKRALNQAKKCLHSSEIRELMTQVLIAHGLEKLIRVER